MGIKNFSKAFNATRTIKWKDYAGKTIAIDAMTELYRAALGASSVAALTDSSGKPTLHISVILSTILEIYRSDVTQIWVFDHNQDPNQDFHNPAKLAELLKRKKKKDDAASEMKTLKEYQQMSEQSTFSDDEEETNPIPSEENAVSQRIDSLEKRTFSATPEMINDIKLMLNCLNIKYMEAPAGCEGEQTASHLTLMGKADAVYSGDTDPVAYGATVLLRRNPRDKKIYEYPIEDIIRQVNEGSAIENPDISHIRIAAVALGTDLAEKSPGIGAKTVLKKLHLIKLTPKQKDAIKEFAAPCDETKLVIYNDDKTPFAEDCMKSELIDWLVNVKSFNKTRITASFDKKAPKKAPKKTVAKSTAAKKTVAKSADRFHGVMTISMDIKKNVVLPPKRVAGKVMKTPVVVASPAEEENGPDEDSE